ncbi:MAG TPA: hypothetical protein VKU60_06725 [Chloroflexota bacterium]|nr:hypothetical protein [Chloroflexota bacterium]
MATDNVTVSGTFRNTGEASSAKHELMGAGFASDAIHVESHAMGRAGIHCYQLRVQAGGRGVDAEQVLRRCGAGDLQMTVMMAAPEPRPEHVPEADRIEQELPAIGHAGASELGSPPTHAPEADVHEQQLPAERVPVSHDGSVNALNPERGSEADQIEQVTPSDPYSDEEEEQLRERR